MLFVTWSALLLTYRRANIRQPPLQLGKAGGCLVIVLNFFTFDQLLTQMLSIPHHKTSGWPLSISRWQNRWEATCLQIIWVGATQPVCNSNRFAIFDLVVYYHRSDRIANPVSKVLSLTVSANVCSLLPSSKQLFQVLQSCFEGKNWLQVMQTWSLTSNQQDYKFTVHGCTNCSHSAVSNHCFPGVTVAFAFTLC